MGYALKEEKTSDIKKNFRTQKNIGNVLGLLFPGSCHIWKGQPIKGTIFIFLFFILLLKAVSIALLEGPSEFLGASKIPEVVTILVFLAFFWLFLVIDAFKLKGKELDERLFL